MPILQVVTFTASSQFIANPGVLKSVLDEVAGMDGCISVFHGLQIEDAKTVYIFSLWESEEQYLSFSGGAGHFTLLAGLKTAAASYPKVIYLDTGAVDAVALSTVFSAPVTEFAFWTLKPDVSPQDVELRQGFEAMKAGLDQVAGVHPPALWAPSKSSARNVVLIVGWDAIEKHLEAVKEGTELHTTGQPLLKKATLVVGHVKLRLLKPETEVD